MASHEAGARRARVVRTVAALATAGVLACATTSSLRDSRGQGLTRFYEAAFESVWHAALHAVRANNLRLDRSDDSERYIVATHAPERTGGDLDEDRVAVEADQGERIAIFVDSVAPGQWAVEVVTRRTFALDPGKTSWAEDIFWVIERDLASGARLERAEEALPDTAANESGQPPPELRGRR